MAGVLHHNSSLLMTSVFDYPGSEWLIPHCISSLLMTSVFGYPGGEELCLVTFKPTDDSSS